MSDKAIVATAVGIAGTIYVAAVVISYQKGKLDGRSEMASAFRTMARDIIKEHLANPKTV